MPSTLARPAHRPPIVSGKTFTKAVVAELSPRQIHRMTVEELVCVVLSVRMSFLTDDVLEHLQYLDRAALERLAFLARRTCRNQGY